MRLDVHQSVFHRKQHSVLLERFRFDRAQWRVVIQNIKSTPERADDKIVFASLNREVAHLNRRQATSQLNPFLSAVDREEETEFSANKKQIRIHMIFGDRPDGLVRRQIAFDRSPGAARIDGLEKIGLEIRVLMVLERDVRRVRIVVRSDDAADVSQLRNVGKLFNPAPVLAPVFAYLNQAIIRTNIDKSFLLRRFSQRRSVAEESNGSILGDRVDALNLSHHRQLVAIQAARELAAKHLPGIAAIVAAKQSVSSKVKPSVRMRTDDEGRIPVPAQRIFAASNLRLNAYALAGALVVANQNAGLQLGVNRVRIFRINLGAKSVTTLRNPPVTVDDARRIARARWPAKRKIVLRAAEHVVERHRIVGRHIVKLRNRQVAFEIPVCAAVKTFIDAAVTADEVVIIISRINPNLVVIDVL